VFSRANGLLADHPITNGHGRTERIESVWQPPVRDQHRPLAGGRDLMLAHRLARLDDVRDLEALIDAAIAQLQKPFLDSGQIASSRAIMGLDTQLIEDGTYFVVTADNQLAGCGGWSRRVTLYGSDRTDGRSPALLAPATDPARIRAMYTHPRHVRKGVGRLIIRLCEAAAQAEGFGRLELMSTMSGEALYRACGYEAVAQLTDDRGGVPVPLIRMAKRLGSERTRA
jgi:GNAT superfamily N-acetyltransferase